MESVHPKEIVLLENISAELIPTILFSFLKNCISWYLKSPKVKCIRTCWCKKINHKYSKYNYKWNEWCHFLQLWYPVMHVTHVQEAQVVALREHCYILTWGRAHFEQQQCLLLSSQHFPWDLHLYIIQVLESW